MLDEHVRELKYAAQMAEINFGMTRTLESFGFQLYSYNESYHQFFADVFKDVKNFTPTQEFFEANRLRMVKAIQNRKMGEPSSLSAGYSAEALINSYASLDELLEVYESVTYDNFLAQKKQWL